MKTIAQTISARLGDNGSRWEDEDGHTLEALCAKQDAVVQSDGHRWRYLFRDGSAIVIAGAAWDTEGSSPYSWAGLE